MGIVKEYEQPTAPVSPLMNLAGATAVFNLLLVNKQINHIKYATGVSTSKIKWFISRVIRIRDLSENLVKGLVIKTAEVNHIDEETGEVVIDTPAVLYASPTSITDLKNKLVESLANNYELTDILYDATSPTELSTAVKYVAEKLINYSNIANDATFSWWKGKVTE